MNEAPLSPELLDLERRIAALPAPPMPAGLHERLARATRAELRRARGRERWAFVAGLAAAAAVLINLSASAGLLAGIAGGPAGPSPSIAAVAAWLRDAAPEISEEEARRQAIVLAAFRIAPPSSPSVTAGALRRHIDGLETLGG